MTLIANNTQSLPTRRILPHFSLSAALLVAVALLLRGHVLLGVVILGRDDEIN
jgi:hypothetical protein